MKKTFISPVAQIVATEAQNIIATSTFSGNLVDNNGTNGGDKTTNPGGITNDARNGGQGTNPNHNSISAYELN